MGQVILWGYVHLVGLAIAVACGWARHPVIGCLLAFPLGLAAWGCAVVACMWLGMPLLAAMAVAAVGLLIAAGVAARRRRADIDRRAIAVAVVALAITAAVAALATAFPLAVVTERGHRILLAATAIDSNPASIDLIWNELPSPPVFHAALHAAAPLLAERPFFAALSPLCAIWCALLLSVGGAVLAGRWCARRATRALVGVVLAGALGSYLFIVQGTAVDLHAAAALFLIAFLIARALGEQEPAPGSMWAELLLLLGFAVQGFATAIAASALLMVTYGGDDRLRVGGARPMFLYTVALTGWHLLLWEAIGRSATAFTTEEALVVTAVPLVALGSIVALPAGGAARRVMMFVGAALLIVAAGLVAGWVWDGDASDRWTALARWIGRRRPGLSDCMLLGLCALCMPLARGPASVAAAASVVILVGVQIFATAGEAFDPRELAGPLRVAAAPPALLLVMLTGVRLLAGAPAVPDRPPGASGSATEPAGPLRMRVAAAPLFAAVIALLVLTNIRLQMRVHRVYDDSLKVLSAGPTSLARDDQQFVYYFVGEFMAGATVVIPRRLAGHAVFFRVLGRVDVEIAEETPRLAPGAVAHLARMRVARRPLYYEVATQTELVYPVTYPRSSRYVLAESAPGRHYLVPAPLYFWLAQTGPAAAGAQR